MKTAFPHAKLNSIPLIALALAALAFGSRTHAATATWSTATTGTNWGVAADWAGNAVPAAGVLEFGATATNGSLYNNITGLSVSSILIDAGAPAYTFSGNSFTLTGAINGVTNNSSNLLTINDPVALGVTSGTTASAFAGTGNVMFTSLVTNSPSGNQTELFNNPLTTFGGGYTTNSGGTRTLFFGGAGNLTISGPGFTQSSATGETFAWEGSGTMTVTGNSSSYGGTAQDTLDAYYGTTVITSGVWASTAGKTSTFKVGNATVTANALNVANTGNALLDISGNVTLGTASTGVQGLTVIGGNGTTSGQGTLSLVDGSVNTLTINNAGASATALTMGGAAGLSSILNMEIGNNASDQIILANTGKASIGAGGVSVNITGLGGFTSGAANPVFTLIAAPGGITTSGFTLVGDTTGNFGGYTTASVSSVSGTALLLTLGSLTPTPGTAYWTGTQAATTWNVMSGGIGNYSNWATTAAGTADTHQIPGAITNVNFAGSTNLSTTLGANTTVNGVTFSSTSPVSIGGTNTLTLAASGTNGLTVTPGSGADTITAGVVLGSSQAWAVNNSPSNPLTVNGAISGGANSLTMSGTGNVVLGGNNTFTGGLTINNGTVILNNAGALNSTTPNAVAFGSSTSNERLQVNSQNITISSLSSSAGAAIVENGGSSNSLLTISQAGSTTYAGVMQDGAGGGTLALAKSGAGTLVLGGANTYSGPTTVSNGTLTVNGSLGSSSSVTVSANSTTSILNGNGTINGPVTLNTPVGAGAVAEILGGTIGSSGTLTLINGLTLNTGVIASFSNGGYINITGGGLTLSGTGVIVQVAAGLAGGTYPLIGYTGLAPTLADFLLQFPTGSATGSNYTLAVNGGVLDLDVTTASTAIPSLTLTVPAAGARVMANTTVAVGGTIGNTGVVSLNGTLADNGGNLTVTGLSPSNPIVVGTGATASYTGSVNTGTTLGTRTLGLIVTDSNADPTSSTANSSVTVLANRVVNASATSFGIVHVGTALSSAVSLTSAGADNNYTRVTVANAGADPYGISVSGGNTATVFNGSNSDSRTLSGTVSTLGPINGAITLVTGSEGLAGEAPVNVAVNYSAQVFSGKAAWTGTGSGTSWGTNGNWGDTQSPDIGGAGAPGVSGALSIGDTAAFGDIAGEASTTSITLDGASPTLAALTLSGTGTSYTISAGTGGSITLQGTATPIFVVGTHTISAVLAGAGLSKTGTGTLMIGGADSYTGATTVANGILQVTTADNRLPIATSLILGDGAANTSGQLVLGDSVEHSQTVGSIVTAGTGNANSVVGNASTSGTLTVNNPTADTFAGALGGAGTNQNNLALVKSGAGTLILTGNNTYSGGTTLSAGILNLGSSGALGTTGTILFSGGTLQFSGSNNTDYSARFAASGNSIYTLDTNGVNVTLGTALPSAGVANGLAKIGAGTLTLSAGNHYTGSTAVNAGILVTQDMLTNTVALGGGVWEPLLTGSTLYTPTLGQTGAGALNTWTGGGFAANGAKLTVNINGGAALNWNSGGFMAAGTAPMVLGAASANNQVEFQNGFDFGPTSGNLSLGFTKVIDVEGSAPILSSASPFGISGNSALLSGVITANVALTGSSTVVGDIGNNGFSKIGWGTLILSGSNTYSGGTYVNGGTLVAGGNALLGVAGVFGDGHSQVNATTGGTNAGLQAIVMANAGPSGGAMDPNSASASPTVLIGGPFTVQLPITISNIPTTGTYGIGGSTDNPSTFSGLITTAQSFTVTQVANTGTNALNITGSITTTPGLNTVKTVTFANAGNVNVSGSMSSALGTLNLTQAGTGVTTVSSRLAYTGTTTVSAGTLVVSGSLSGTLAVNANASGTLILAGTGLYSNPVNSAASLTLGSTSGGTLAMNNDGTNLGGTHSSQTFANLTLANSSTIDLGSNSTGNGNTLLFSGSTNLSNYVSLTITHWSGSVYALGSTTDTGGLTQDNLLFANNPAFGALGTAITSINIYNDSNVWIGYGMEVTDGVDTELVATASVPEPGTWAMLLAGAATLIASRQISRKRR